MKHTPQAITTTPANARVILDVAGDPASLPLSTAVQSQGDGRYLLASAVSPYMLTLLNDADAAAAFATLGGSSGPGWVRLPGGLLVQWGTSTQLTTSGGGMAINLPTAYQSGTSYSIVVQQWRNSSVTLVPQLYEVGFPTANAFYILIKETYLANQPYASSAAQVSWITVGI